MLEIPFFNRDAELEQLLLPLRQRRDWSLILGPRKSGKTRLLHELRVRIGDRALTVYLDLWERTYDGPRMLRDLMLGLLDAASANVEAFARRGPAPSVLAATGGDAALLGWLRTVPSGSPAAQLADTIAGLWTAMAEPRRLPSIIGAVIDLPDALARVAKRPVWVIWDEFQEMESVRFNAQIDLFALLRSRWQAHRNAHYVVAGSRRSALERIALDSRAPFFQHFDVVVVDQFAPPVASDFLLHAAKALGRTIPRSIADEAVALVGGLPFHLTVIAQDIARRQGRVNRSHLIECLDQQLHQPHGRLHLYFTKLYDESVGHASGLARVLDTLHQPRTVGEIARASGLPATSVNAYVGRLIDTAVIVREGGRVSVVDAAFAMWLAGRGGFPRGVPTVHLGSESERRVAEFLAELGFNDIFLARASRGAFDLVASYAATLIGFQVKRSRLPLRISRTAVERMRARAGELEWRARIAVDTSEEIRIYDLEKLRFSANRAVIDVETQPLMTVREILGGTPKPAARGLRAAKVPTRRRGR